MNTIDGHHHIQEQIIDFLSEDFMDDHVFRSLPVIPRPCDLSKMIKVIEADIKNSYHSSFSWAIWRSFNKSDTVHLLPWLRSYVCAVYCFLRHYLGYRPFKLNQRWNYLRKKIHSESDYLGNVSQQDNIVSQWWFFKLLLTKYRGCLATKTKRHLHHYYISQLFHHRIGISEIRKTNCNYHQSHLQLDRVGIPYFKNLDDVWPSLQEYFAREFALLQVCLKKYPEKSVVLIFRYATLLLQLNQISLLKYFLVTRVLLENYQTSVVYRMKDMLDDLYFKR